MTETSHQNSSPEQRTGHLYLVATPIGNLEDITLRALRILREADQIACEDTRHTLKLLNHFEIHKPLVSYHEHNEMTRAPELVLAMEQGAQIALVSDAGMPLVSDPGHRLVALAIRHHIAVIPIPGPAALLAALSASGLPSEEFLFLGFLPPRSGERRRALEHLRIEDRTLIFYEAPHRIAETIADALEILGDRPACLAREVTKLHEEFRRENLSEMVKSLEERPAKGEITLLIGAAAQTDAASHADTAQALAARVEELMHQAKLDRKEALKLAAKERGLSRRTPTNNSSTTAPRQTTSSMRRANSDRTGRRWNEENAPASESGRYTIVPIFTPRIRNGTSSGSAGL